MRPLAGAFLAVDGEAREDSPLSPGIAPRRARGHHDPCSPSPGRWVLLHLCAPHQAALADRIKASTSRQSRPRLCKDQLQAGRRAKLAEGDGTDVAQAARRYGRYRTRGTLAIHSLTAAHT